MPFTGRAFFWYNARMDALALAKIAYTAYVGTTFNMRLPGEPVPTWDNLPDVIQNAWMVTANAVAVAVLVAFDPPPQHTVVAASDVRECALCHFICPPIHAYSRCPGCQQVYDA